MTGAALRKRLQRERAARGLAVVPVIASEEVVHQLTESGFLDPLMTDDRAAIGAAIARVLQLLVARDLMGR